MATTKITITLQADQVEAIRALVAAGRSPNVSAFVQHAVGVALFDAAGWREMLEDALQQTGGPLTKKERDWADALLSPERQEREAQESPERAGLHDLRADRASEILARRLAHIEHAAQKVARLSARPVLEQV